MTIKYYTLLILLFCTSLLLADEVKFTASVSKNQVATGEQFEVTFSLNNNADRFSPPDFRGFQVLSGPNESSSMTSINGNMSSSISISYILVAVKEGVYSIGPATITVNGRQLATQVIKIKVVKGQAVQQNNSAAQAGQNYDVPESSSEDLSKSIFIRAVVDKTNVYQGEQLTLSYKLYTRVAIVDNGMDKIPDLNGFWSQDIKNSNQNAQWKIERYKGLEYNVTAIKQTILFAEHSGNLTIDPMAMTFIIRQSTPAKDIMDQFFNGGGGYKDLKYKVKSAPVTIHVKPLPEAGKPEGFSGAVGSFAINASLDKNELKANEALNYKFRITGSGNIKLFEKLNINFPANFEKYDPKITDTISENIRGVSGKRVYNYLLIPRHEGNYIIDPFKFSYFNPATGRYVTLSSKDFEIKVNKGISEGNVAVFSSTDKQDIKTLNKDIRYIKTGSTDLYKESEELYGSALYYLLLSAGPLLFLSAFAFRKWEEKNNSDPVKVKNRKAGKIAVRRMANAEKQLAANNTKAFYEDVFRGIYGYLSDKLNIPFAHLNKETIAGELKVRSLNDQLINQLLDTLDLCEMARFAPVSGISEREVLEKAKNMIHSIEVKI